jgi:hypothetical protein
MTAHTTEALAAVEAHTVGRAALSRNGFQNTFRKLKSSHTGNTSIRTIVVTA